MWHVMPILRVSGKRGCDRGALTVKEDAE